MLTSKCFNAKQQNFPQHCATPSKIPDRTYLNNDYFLKGDEKNTFPIFFNSKTQVICIFTSCLRSFQCKHASLHFANMYPCQCDSSCQASSKTQFLENQREQ